jgi:hypothetical protein
MQPSSDDLQTEGFEVYHEFIEVETGKGGHDGSPAAAEGSKGLWHPWAILSST